MANNYLFIGLKGINFNKLTQFCGILRLSGVTT